MNKDEVLKQLECDEDVYAFGMSSLHCWIRFLECLLHVSYRLSFEKWSITTKEHKKEAKKIKTQIQLAYRKEKGENIFNSLCHLWLTKRLNLSEGLLLDVVKQGSGTTNDGNTARTFFAGIRYFIFQL